MFRRTVLPVNGGEPEVVWLAAESGGGVGRGSEVIPGGADDWVIGGRYALKRIPSDGEDLWVKCEEVQLKDVNNVSKAAVFIRTHVTWHWGLRPKARICVLRLSSLAEERLRPNFDTSFTTKTRRRLSTSPSKTRAAWGARRFSQAPLRPYFCDIGSQFLGSRSLVGSR